MRMVSCLCNVSVLARVLKVLDKNGVQRYQIIDRVTGKTSKGDPRMDTAVWPGYSSLVTMQFEHDGDAKRVLLKLKDFNQHASNDSELLTCYSHALDELFCG